MSAQKKEWLAKKKLAQEKEAATKATNPQTELQNTAQTSTEDQPPSR